MNFDKWLSAVSMACVWGIMAPLYIHTCIHRWIHAHTHNHFLWCLHLASFFFLISRSTDFSWFMFYKQCLVKLWKDDLLCFKQFVPSLCVYVENSIAFLQGWNHICVGARLFLDTSLWCGYHEYGKYLHLFSTHF